MDLLDELEAMANAVSQSGPDGIDITTLDRWQYLFGYSSSEAIDKIKEYRANLYKFVVSDSHWDMARDMKELEGFDREAYEYSCTITTRKSRHKMTLTPQQKEKLLASTFLVKLEGPLMSAEAVAKAANMASLPQEEDLGQGRSFCRVNGLDKLAIEAFLSESNIHSTFSPTFIRVSMARKELSIHSIYPTLGVDSTRPQHRLRGETNNPQPAQNEYPVWHFFYGTLAQSDILSDLLGTDPAFHDAKISGGVLGSWGNYKALVDDRTGKNTVHGKAFWSRVKRMRKLCVYMRRKRTRLSDAALRWKRDGTSMV